MLSKTCTIISLLLATQLANGDTFIMKNGTELTGSIISETDSSYIARIEVSPTIFEQKELAKSDVAKIIADEKGLKEFKALGKLVALPDLSAAKDYQARITDVSTFLEAFPESSHHAAVSQYLNSLQQEFSKVSSGMRKVDGSWLSQAEMDRRGYEIEAKLLLKNISDKYRNGLVLGALRDYHADYPNFAQSAIAPDLRRVAAKSLQSYKRYLTKEIEQSKKRVEKREIGLRNTTASERRRLEGIFAAEQAEYVKRAKKDEAEGQIWLVVSGFDTEGLEDALKLIEREERKLDQNHRTGDLTTEELLQNFWAAIDEKNVDEARDSLSAIERMNLSESYFAPLKAAFESLKEPTAEKVPEPEPEPARKPEPEPVEKDEEMPDSEEAAEDSPEAEDDAAQPEPENSDQAGQEAEPVQAED